MTAINEQVSTRREILRLGLPFTVGVLSTAAAGVVDTAMMGRFGERPLAAVASASAVFDIFNTLVLGTVVGHQILSARFAGRQDGRRIAGSLRSTAVLSAAVALPLMIACLFAGRPLTGLLLPDSDTDIAVLGGEFLVAISPTLILAPAFVALTATLNAFKLARRPMVAGIVVAGANVLLDWLLIYGPGPFPRLGAAGAGLATSISWLVGVLVLVGLALGARLGDNLRSSNDQHPDFETSVVRLAAPAMVSSVLDYGSTAVFFGIVGSLGASALAGGRIAFHVVVLIFGLGTAFSAAVRILVGRALGAGESAQIRDTWQSGRTTLVVPGIAVGALLILLRGPVASLFTSFAGVKTELEHALVIIGFVVPIIAWNLSNVSVVRAFGRTRLDMYGNLAAAIGVQLPVAWLLGDVLGLGTIGAFGGMAACWIVRGSLLEVWARRLIMERARRPSDLATSSQGRVA